MAEMTAPVPSRPRGGAGVPIFFPIFPIFPIFFRFSALFSALFLCVSTPYKYIYANVRGTQKKVLKKTLFFCFFLAYIKNALHDIVVTKTNGYGDI